MCMPVTFACHGIQHTGVGSVNLYARHKFAVAGWISQFVLQGLFAADDCLAASCCPGCEVICLSVDLIHDIVKGSVELPHTIRQPACYVRL